MTLDELTAALAKLQTGESLALAHDDIAVLFPPGLSDQRTLTGIGEFRLQNECTVRDEENSVVFTKGRGPSVATVEPVAQ
jgi:hypothetical protein